MRVFLPLKLMPGLLLATIALSLTGAFNVAKAQNQQNIQVEEKRQAERINEQKLASLMAVAGIQVDQASRVNLGETYQSLQLKLNTNSNAAVSTSLAQTFSTNIRSSERRNGELPRHRSVELSSQHLVVLTVDSANRLRWWTLISDPRLIRAEEADVNNRLSGSVVYQPDFETIVEIPDDPVATELRFYHPQYTGDHFDLTLVSTVSLNKN